jgi:NAD(P)-dependent dehydrogenase (short-subunit alcohol dehydrogenase family)
MQESLANRVIVITGAASGIGRACAQELARAGSRVALVDVNGDGLAALVSELGPGVETLAIAASVRSESDMQRMAEETVAHFGRIDGLVACAGILRRGQTLKTVGDTSLEDWDAIIEINLTGTFLSNRAVLPAMLAQKQGDIINMSSTSGRQGRPFDGPYCASKFGIIGLSEALAEEVGRHGVRVQTILPDAVETPLWSQNGPAALKPPQTIPAERVAQLVCYMLALPRDTYLLNPVIAPCKTRKKRGGADS